MSTAPAGRMAGKIKIESSIPDISILTANCNLYRDSFLNIPPRYGVVDVFSARAVEGGLLWVLHGGCLGWINIFWLKYNISVREVLCTLHMYVCGWEVSVSGSCDTLAFSIA